MKKIWLAVLVLSLPFLAGCVIYERDYGPGRGYGYGRPYYGPRYYSGYGYRYRDRDYRNYGD